jgi:hypothetical protein
MASFHLKPSRYQSRILERTLLADPGSIPGVGTVFFLSFCHAEKWGSVDIDGLRIPLCLFFDHLIIFRKLLQSWHLLMPTLLFVSLRKPIYMHIV